MASRSAPSPWSTARPAGRTPEELRTAEIASRRAALALDNARLAAANQQVAERLQLSLLSPPVQPDRLQLAVRYRPATQGVSIGGDWYDAFLQPDGDTVLVIGDVMGHDIEAAAAMGQVKTLVRGIAFDRLEEPAGVLRRVDHALVGLAVPDARDRAGLPGGADAGERAEGLRRLRWASAGHPEPMLVDEGTVVDLSAPVGPPLGIGWLGPRADGEALMPVGSTLVLFTDGLFERRGIPLDEGRAQVRELLRASVGLSLEELCDRLLTRLVGEGAEDDVAVLAVRAHPWTPSARPRPGPSCCHRCSPSPEGRSLAQPTLIAKATRKPTAAIRPVQIAVFSKASGIIVSATIVRIAPAATAVMTAISSGGAFPSVRVADQSPRARWRRRSRPTRRTRSGPSGRCSSCRPRWTAPPARSR